MGDGDARATRRRDGRRGARRARAIGGAVRARRDADEDDAKRRDATFDEAKRRDDGGARGRGARETVGLTTTRNDAATRADEGDSFAR